MTIAAVGEMAVNTTPTPIFSFIRNPGNSGMTRWVIKRVERSKMGKKIK